MSGINHPVKNLNRDPRQANKRLSQQNLPCVDGSGLARRIFTSQATSVRPCVRPLGAVHMTAGHNALRGSGPGQKVAFDDAMAQWVVLIAGSTGSASVKVRLPQALARWVEARS
jgi:hypothetical protein